MVRAVMERWEGLAQHPLGRWVRLVLEVLWYLTLVLAIRACWALPQTWFGYMGV